MVTFKFWCADAPVIANRGFSTDELPIEPSYLGGNSVNTEVLQFRTCLQVSVLYLPSYAFLDQSAAFSKPQFVHLLKI